MTDSILILAEHAATTLPTCIAQRKRVLRTLSHVLPDSHPCMCNVRTQLSAIATLERLQEQLPLKFRRPE